MGSTQNTTDNDVSNDDANDGYVEYETDDVTYFGATKIIAEERKHILRRRNPDAENQNSENQDNDDSKEVIIEDLNAIALSGGGIRSASFCLGVLQALSYKNVLNKIDYLSTVSGGGYIGSSLTWLLSRRWFSKLDEDGNRVEESGKKGVEIKLDVGREKFPYGTFPMLGQLDEEKEKAIKNDKQQEEFHKDVLKNRHRGSLLRYLRQHGKYLTPGHGINGFSLLGVLLRGSILSIFIYFSLLVLLMTGLKLAHAFDSFNDTDYSATFDLIQSIPNFTLMAGLAGLVVFTAIAPFYSFFAYWLSRRKSSQGTTEETESFLEGLSYGLRRTTEIIYNYLLKISVLIIIVGLIPVVHGMLTSNPDGNLMAGLTGTVSTVIGFISSISAYIKTGSNKKGIIPVGLLVFVGTVALWFGLLILAYHCSLTICDNTFLLLPLAATVIVVGWFANLNYISVHRYYRDRLMETFMPDVPEVSLPEKTPQYATADADKARIGNMCGYNGKDKHLLQMPYHIINTNLVLVSSKKAKFKGRGGDNFILTPAYCGSNATGWQESRYFMDGRMTLPTAMAISGAAVNPSTGVGGDGLTRQPFLSMLMGFLNIRLGYWAPHPNPKKHNIFTKIPNFFIPGFFEMFVRTALRENSQFLQLSDGGHFENLGIYELVRRKSNVIISCDGAADPNYEFTDLANALEKIRADFGVLIDIPGHKLEALVPKTKTDFDKSEYAKKGFIVADIHYPDRDPGVFIYIKSTFFKSLSADLYGYKQTHKEFPDEPTSDQFFDEKQFEAYRELGYQTAWNMMHNDSVKANTTLNELFHG